ncbi:hypothetical protein ABGB07_31785 [Micromonosporaceae bacterium B7E4]
MLAESPAQLSSMGFSVAGSVVKDGGFAQQESGIHRQDVNESHNGSADIFTDYFYDYHDLLETEGNDDVDLLQIEGSTNRAWSVRLLTRPWLLLVRARPVFTGGRRSMVHCSHVRD